MATVGAFTRSVWGKRLPVSGAAAPAKTYTDFVAYITAQATGGAKTWGTTAIVAPGSYTTTAATAAGTMTGSVWNSYADASIAPCRIVQHGLPTSAEFTSQVAAVRQIFFRAAGAGNQIGFTGLNRNGYASTSFNDGGSYPAINCDLILYWDGTQAQQMNPSTGTGPTPFVIP